MSNTEKKVHGVCRASIHIGGTYAIKGYFYEWHTCVAISENGSGSYGTARLRGSDRQKIVASNVEGLDPISLLAKVADRLRHTFSVCRSYCIYLHSRCGLRHNILHISLCHLACFGPYLTSFPMIPQLAKLVFVDLWKPYFCKNSVFLTRRFVRTLPFCADLGVWV